MLVIHQHSQCVTIQASILILPQGKADFPEGYAHILCVVLVAAWGKVRCPVTNLIHIAVEKIC